MSEKRCLAVKREKKYYLDILHRCEKQKDLRICKQQRLYEREFDELTSGIKGTIAYDKIII